MAVVLVLPVVQAETMDTNKQQALNWLDGLYDHICRLEGNPQISNQVPRQIMEEADRLANVIGWYLDSEAPMKKS